VQSLANGLAAGLLVPLVWGSLGGLAATSAAVMVAGAALLGLQRLSSPAAVR